MAPDRAPTVAIVTDDPGWHGRRLVEAFAARGLATRYVSLVDCSLGAGDGRALVHLPGFASPPAGVFVRGVPGGTLEQVVLRLDVLHLLEADGIPVCNAARAIERTVDKAMTSMLLARAGIPTPPTWVCESAAAAAHRLRAEFAAGHRVVAKPLFGSQGEGLRLLGPDGSDAADAALMNGVAYLQRYVPSAEGECRDWRVLVIEGRACAAMIRRSRHWITNRAQGGRCEAAPLDAELARLAESAAAAVGAIYAGVDLLRGADGRWLVSEVNGVPAWYGLQGVCRIDLAQRLADVLIGRMQQNGAAASGTCR